MPLPSAVATSLRTVSRGSSSRRLPFASAIDSQRGPMTTMQASLEPRTRSGGRRHPRHDIALVLRGDRRFSAAEATAFFDGYSLFVDRTTCGWFQELDEFF
jgi:hypothetical protein